MEQTYMTKAPQIIQRYFQSVNAHDTVAMASCFASEAVVHDEGNEYIGIDAITAWIEATTAKYRVTTEIISLHEEHGKTIATNLVTGNFTGSPLSLRYHFILKENSITGLSITG